MKVTEELTKAQLGELYRQMYLIRRFEETAEEQYMRGKIRGFLHVYIGEEANAVGAISALEPRDYVVTHYRDHGHALARGLETKIIMAELFGKATGCSKGKGGSMHLFDASRNFMGGYAIVGGQLPIAVGLGVANTVQNRDSVVLVFLGDGALNEGEFHESMNMAAIWKLPVIFFLENNLYGMGSHVEEVFAVKELYRVAEPYGVPSVQIDGMDVLAVREATQDVVDRVRSGGGPYFIEATTYRFRGHSMADPSGYRGKEEEEHWRKRDPITLFHHCMSEGGHLTADELKELETQVEQEIAEAIQFADESPEPQPEALWENIYWNKE